MPQNTHTGRFNSSVAFNGDRKYRLLRDDTSEWYCLGLRKLFYGTHNTTYIETEAGTSKCAFADIEPMDNRILDIVGDLMYMVGAFHCKPVLSCVEIRTGKLISCRYIEFSSLFMEAIPSKTHNKNYSLVQKVNANEFIINTDAVPLIIGKLHLDTARLDLVAVHKTSFLSDVRCTSDWVPYNGQWLTVFHRNDPGTKYKPVRRYNSYFVSFDKSSYKPLAMTKALCLDKEPHYRIQFASSMYWENDALFVEFGAADTYVAKVKVDLEWLSIHLIPL